MAQHRTGLRVGVVVFLLLSVLFGGYVLVTEGLTGAIGGAIAGIAGSAVALVTISNVPRYVDSWDLEHPSSPSE